MSNRVFLFAAAAAPLLAHEGEPPAPHDILTAWAFEPLPVICLALSAWLYFRGSRPASRGIKPWEAFCWWAGWAALAFALISPLHPLGSALFSAHMAQHEILMAIAAPLIVLGRPLVAFLWAMPFSWRRAAGRGARAAWFQRTWRWLTEPFTAFLLHGVALWVWHIPRLFQATLSSELIHTAQHLSFLLSALLFWWALLRGRDGRMGYGAAFLYVFATAMHSGILGALLTFAPVPLYPAYIGRTAAWGLTPLEDQQLAGLIMWVPAGVVYLVAALGIFGAWLRKPALSLPLLAAFLVLTGCGESQVVAAAKQMTGGDPGRGKVAIDRYGCSACHTIGGIPGAVGKVGPPLNGIAGRAYVAGVLPNSPQELVRWIQNPKAIDEKTAMPSMGVSEQEARDIAAYLYTLP